MSLILNDYVADRQGLDSKEHFQPHEKTIPIYNRAAPCNLLQNVFKKHNPWPAARDAPPIIRGAHANNCVLWVKKRDGPLRVPQLRTQLKR